MSHRRWTAEDLELFLKLWPTTTSSEVARRLGRSVPTLYTKASQLGIRKQRDAARDERSSAAIRRHEADRQADHAEARHKAASKQAATRIAEGVKAQREAHERASSPQHAPYRKALHRAAKEALMAVGLSEAAAAVAVAEIAHGKVPRVRIDY